MKTISSILHRVRLLTHLGPAAFVLLPMLASASSLPPTVTIITPLDGATVIAGTNLLLGANAIDVDDGIRTVEFFAGLVRLGQAHGPLRTPYGNWLIIWSNVPPGDFALTAKATDFAGQTAASDPVCVHLLPLTPEECRRDGFQFILSGDAPAGCVIETSTDLLHWTPLHEDQTAVNGWEVVCPNVHEAAARFFRVRLA